MNIQFIKIMEFCLKWVHMARYELILKLDGAQDHFWNLPDRRSKLDAWCPPLEDFFLLDLDSYCPSWGQGDFRNDREP